MIGGVPGWSPDLERSFKEVLYRFLEEVQSTKAALYLLAPDGDYVLMTQYGFGRRDLLAAELHARDPLVMKAREQRDSPRRFNNLHEVPELAGYMAGAGTARMMLTPLYSASRVIGFVDARDKGRKRPFEDMDERLARAIAVSLVLLVEQAGLYPEVTMEPGAQTVEGLSMDELRVFASPTEAVFDAVALRRLLDRAVATLHRSGVVAVTLTLVDEGAAGSVLLVPEGSAGIEADVVLRHQAEALRASGVPVPDRAVWEVVVRPVPSMPEAPGLRLVATSVVPRSQGWAVAVTAIGVRGSLVAHEAVEELVRSAEEAQTLSRLRFARRMVARRLLRPGEREFPELEAHSQAVSRLAWAVARAGGLSADEVEDAAIAGLLHDVGMRELDYDQLYRHPAPGPDERRRYQEHVEIGERLLRGSGEVRVAAAIRHHHERWDGQGYPDRLSGEEIPVLARVVHAAEVFDVLTSATSYVRPVSVSRAVEILRAAAGEQFDRELVERLAGLVVT